MSNTEVTVSSGSRQVVPGSQLNSNQEMMMSYSDNTFASSYENHENEEEFPRYTTKELRDHFERTIEEAAPHKPVRTGHHDINRSKWSSHVTQNNVVTSEVCEASATAATQDTTAAVMDYDDFPPPPADDSDYLPPPPPDLLQMPSESQHIPECDYSLEPQEAANPSKYPLNKEAYFKQRSMSELKRLYKHIHPEVRKNIEKEVFTDFNETENNHIESQEYMYEDDGDSPNDMNPDDEYGEWEEILPGEVQSMRWMFENKPLDTIRDETLDEDDDKKITQQEVILGKDVRRTAWMFETKPMDELGSHDMSSTEYKNKFNKFNKGDVRAAAWLFETQTMDSLNKMHKEEDLTKEIVFTEEDENATIYMIDNKYMESLGHTETIDESHLLILRSVLEEINGEVKTVTSTFDTQFKCILMGQSSQMLEIKSVRKIETELENSIASRWLFDTQPLDITTTESSSYKLVCSLSMEDSNKGDWGRWLFEIKTLNSLTDWESSQLEKKEIVGADVRKHCLVFETQPMDSLKDDSNAKPQSMEEIIGGNVRSARNFFESSPQVARKNCLEVGKLKKATVNEDMKGDVRHQKWRFESQPLEHIREEKKEFTRTVNVEDDLTQEDGTSCKADVRKNCWVFETQPMDTLKDDSNTPTLTKEEIIAGNVKSARHYFETAPPDEIKELAEVGKLKKTVALEEERGDVRHQTWRFESHPLEQIREEKKEVIRTIDLEEIDKVDVLNYKQIFETSALNKIDESQKILIEGVTSGSVQSNKNLFESSQLYAMQDSSGHFHEVKTVRREEVVKGDVTTCKWMFETRPIDQFDESITKYQIIKGISKEEIESGDVKTAKWLFETQPLDAIKYFSNIEDEEMVATHQSSDETMKGDVKTCKWLFETKPMDILYERTDVKGENESEQMPKGDVKTCTWLFETQALDTIHDETETVMKACTVNQEDIRGKDVRTACFLFETENLENLSGEEAGSFKRITEIDIGSGDVSRMKYIFENQTSDIMTSTSEEAMQNLKRVQTEDIQKGNVVNCKWLFENQSIDTIHDSQEESISNRTTYDVKGGNVNQGRFIFETYSLDKIQDVSSETDTELKRQKIVREEDEKGDVRNYTMMFETQPLYAIQDKEGHYHEVTTVTSEEVTHGDVVGTRWLFETKPLDAIKDTDEVYIIKSVTQQDVQKGDVTSAKWKFETQPLDRIAEERKALIKTVDDIQGGNVRMNKHRFESDALSAQSVKTVNVSEIQKGDVRTAKWRFETQSIDKIRSMSSENLIETVQKEDVAKGDVKQSVWLFEKNPLDHIKETDEEVDITVTQEEIPKADVKTTTWLFETTPFDDFNESKMEKTEIIGKSVKGTLEELYSQKMVKSKGILIEADEIGDVRMAKYQLMNQEAPEIQREDIIRGDLQTIMMNLLNKNERQERQVVIDSEEKGNISSTVQQLFNQEKDSSMEREEILRGDIQEAINNLFQEGNSAKHGILIQEDEKGDVQMTLYSLLNKQEATSVEKEDIVRGDIKSALQKLSSADKLSQSVKIKVDETEKGHVNFYSTCIESGSLDYLKQLHVEPDETAEKVEKERIVGGDIKGTKLILCQNQAQIERTVEDVIPGDVHNAVKVFMSEPSMSLEKLQKEEIVKGDLRAALSSLSESANQTVVVEKEEVVKGNIPKALRCLERAQKRSKEVDKPDIIPGNIRGALRSLEKSATTRADAIVEDLVPGDVKATLKSLELAKQTVKEVEKEEIVRGDIHMAMQNLQDASSERRKFQQEIDVQGDVRGTIQLFMEPPPSPRLQRSASVEGDVKGDVKMSIRSLYESQEQTQLEKEEVVKGDVKGTIKSLLETAQRQTPKVRLGAYRRVKVKQSPPVKNLNPDAQRTIQKIKTANVTETSKENHTITNECETKSELVEQSTHQTKSVVEHRTITQNHGIKTLKTEFRNLKSNPKGMIKLDKTKVQTDVYIMKPQALEPDLPLPPPPPALVDADLLPPPPTPPPPSADSDIDHLPPPPPPLPSEQDFLPPPPSPHELETMPAQAAHPAPGKAKKMMVKKVKGPNLHPVPKLEHKVEINKTQTVEVTSQKMVEMSQNQSQTVTQTTKTVRSEIPMPPVSPQPLKKVHITPIKFTPPPSPPPSMKGKMTKFNTPLIKAEEKYRKLKEDNTPPTTPPPTYIHDSVTAALEVISTRDSDLLNNTGSDVTQQSDERTKLTLPSDLTSHELSKHIVVSDSSKINDNQEKFLKDSTVVSSKQETVSNDSSRVVSIQQTSSVAVVKKEMHTTSQKTVSVSSKQSTQSVKADRVQGQITDGAKVENMTSAAKKDLMNQKTNSYNKCEVEMLKSSQKIYVPTVNPDTTITNVQSVNFDKIQSESKAIKDETVLELAAKKEKTQKSPQRESKKKSDHSPTKSPEMVSNQPAQTEKPLNGNGKNAKQNHKGKKNNKQEKQVDIKVLSENEKQGISVDLKEEVKEAAEVKVISEVKMESKQEVKKNGPVASVSSTSENQTAAKKKKKNKKSKGVLQSGQGKQICVESKMEVAENKQSTSESQLQETISVAQIHTSVKQEQIHIKKEVFTQERKDNQNSHEQKAVQKDVKGSVTEKEISVSQEPPEDARVVPITLTGKSEQSEVLKSATERSDGSQTQKVQVLISHIMELQRVSEKSDWKSVKILLNTVPDWIISPERKCELEQTVAKSDAQKNQEILSELMKVAQSKLMDLEDNETMEKHECEAVSEKCVAGGASPRISKISIGSAKVEYQTKKTTSQERRKEEVSYVKSMDLRAPSPLLKMRSPSPSFITIESTRRTDSPQRVTPSPTLLHRPPTPPTPPPRRCDTPSRMTRITPSPTFDRAENLARLKDTTAKLSRGVTPPPILSPQQISEKKSEIVESPSSFHRQIKIDTQVVEDKEKNKKDVDVTLTSDPECFNLTEVDDKCNSHLPSCQNDLDDLGDAEEVSSASVRERREFFEEAQKAGINKTYVRKEPIAIPERLGPDMEECIVENKNKEKDDIPRADLSSLVNKFESAEEKTYIRKELIPLADWLHNSSESTACDKEEADVLEQEMPTFDIQAIKNVFELGEQSSLFTDEKKNEEELVSSLTETTADTSKRENSQEKKGGSRRSTPLPPQKNEVETVPAQPAVISEAKSITEHFSNVDEFGNKVTGTRTTVTEHSESTQRVPFSYADAVKRKAAKRAETYDEDATENLLRNFHKTWTESETVFKSLGYTVSEEMSQVMSHHTEMVSSVPKSELCTVCRRRAYPMDALIVDKKKYHKTCFRCEHCRNTLSLGNYVSLHGHFYCLHHYKQLLKTKGNYDNELMQQPPAGSGGSDEQLEWRYSTGSLSSENKAHGNKISVVWPPQADHPKKMFKIEEDIQLTKPQWPPPDTETPTQSPKAQHRKAVPRSVL